MKNTNITKLTIEIADIHALRLETALTHLQYLIPFTAESFANLSDENLGFLELASSRFAKLQDIIGSKIFQLFLESVEEDIAGKSFLDQLNKLERLNIIPNADYWIKMREIRNQVTHEYPDNPTLMATNLNELVAYSYELLNFWKTFKKQLNSD